MIFVTVGAARGFTRLVAKMDEIAGKIDEEVIIQIGHTDYKPIHAKYFTLGSQEEILKLLKEARIVVSHGGESSIANTLEVGCSAIIVPRLKKYHEAVDDHQLEHCHALENTGKINGVYDIENLEAALANPRIMKRHVPQNERPLVHALRKYIQQFDTTTK